MPLQLEIQTHFLQFNDELSHCNRLGLFTEMRFQKHYRRLKIPQEFQRMCNTSKFPRRLRLVTGGALQLSNGFPWLSGSLSLFIHCCGLLKDTINTKDNHICFCLLGINSSRKNHLLTVLQNVVLKK